MKKRTTKLATALQIFLVISLSFTTAYLIQESSNPHNVQAPDNNLVINYQNPQTLDNKFSIINKLYISIINLIFSEKTLVSAQLLPTVFTCIRSITDKSCQEIVASSQEQCDALCEGVCLPTQRENTQECKPGTCITPEGNCQTGSPQVICEPSGQWFDDEVENILQCTRGCCLLGNQALFINEQQCTTQSDFLGLEAEFKPEIKSEIECLALSEIQIESACVIQETCEFTSQQECINIQGEFIAPVDGKPVLCTNSDLNTNCERTSETTCIPEKDEVYFIDSCGNKANIYDFNKKNNQDYWEFKLPNEEICELGTSGNPARNQEKCGNCNYFLGSVCGTPLESDKQPSLGDFICRDISCTDDSGNRRENGESWCKYQSSIGPDYDRRGNPIRSTDTPGSRHFRQNCANGEIRTEPCADFRNEICVESQTKEGSQSFSSAACRLNRWQICLNYNVEPQDLSPSEAQDQIIDKCSQNDDCFVKDVFVDTDFNFKICAPKYPEGFDLSTNPEAAEVICSLASQQCTVIYVKKESGWECIANCECEEAIFAQEMNDLCMSLGDCGASVNYQGELSESYKVSNSPKLSRKYKNDISKYSNHKNSPNIFAEAGNFSEFYGQLGIPEGLGEVQEPDSDSGLGGFGIVSGLLGTALIWAGSTSKGANLLELTKLASTTGGEAAGPGLTGAGGAVAGAAIGAAVTSMIIEFTGIGPGLSDGTESALILAGATTAGAIGFAATSLSSFTAGTAIAEGTFLAAGSTLASTSTIQGGTVLGSGSSISSGSALLSGGGGSLEIGALIPAGKTATISSSTATIGSSATVAGEGALIGNGGAIAGEAGATQLAGTGGAASSGLLVAAIIAAIVIISIIIFFALAGVGDTKEVIVDFQCQPWQAPLGGADCEKCGSDNLPCSKYSCQSLGQTCEFLNEGTDEEICADVNPEDSTAPIINPWPAALSNNSQYVPLINGVEIEGPESCYKESEKLNFGIFLNEPAECRFDTSPAPFNNMEFNLGGRNLFLTHHQHELLIPSLASLGLPGFNPNRRADYDLYIKCQDKSGNANINAYNIKFCVKAGEDITAPRIQKQEPEFVAFNISDQETSIYTNEPAECKYETTEKDYEQMENDFICNNDFADQTISGFQCTATLPITQDESKFYVRCKDKPWETQNDKRNTNDESYELILTRTEELIITSKKPAGILTASTPLVSVDLEVKTSGGLNPTCSYLWNNFDINFLPSSNGFIQPLRLASGDYNIPITCQDDLGNKAEDTISFKIEIDNNAPKITRVYDRSGELYIITNEPSTCSYTHNSCNFDINNATDMTGSQLTHSTPFAKHLNHYIKCQDSFNNRPGGCSIIVRGG